MTATKPTTETDDILESVREQLESLADYGQLQFHVKKHSGKFSKTDMVKMTSVKFTDKDPNITATTRIFQLIKGVQDALLTGSLTFTLKFDKGLAEQMMVQDFKKL